MMLDPIPQAFALAAWQRIATEITASVKLKAAMQEEALRLQAKNCIQREFTRGMGAVLHGKPWYWPKGEALLAKRLGEPPHADDLLEALYSWFMSATHKLYRRGQIRALLATGMGHVILVSADTEDGEPVPCGAVDQQVLTVSDDVLKRMPPCRHPFCACSWALTYPDYVK